MTEEELLTCETLIDRLAQHRIAIVCNENGLNLLPAREPIPDGLLSEVDLYHLELMEFMTHRMRTLTNAVEEIKRRN